METKWNKYSSFPFWKAGSNPAHHDELGPFMAKKQKTTVGVSSGRKTVLKFLNRVVRSRLSCAAIGSADSDYRVLTENWMVFSIETDYRVLSIEICRQRVKINIRQDLQSTRFWKTTLASRKSWKEVQFMMTSSQQLMLTQPGTRFWVLWMHTNPSVKRKM